MENGVSVHQRRFEAAVKVMRTLPADGAFVPSDDLLMKFYTYHKQATAGAWNGTRTSGRDAPSKAEREAWKALGDMSKENAMKAYVEEILQILEMVPVTDEVSDLLEVLEPFYEVVEDEDEDEHDDMPSRPAMSTFSGSSDEWRGSSGEDVDDDVEEEDNAEDEMRLTVASRAERGGSAVCNGSVSHLTKSTHSSLNTDEEEEELGHSRETSRETRREARRETSRETRRDSPHRFLPLHTHDGGDVSEPEQLREVCGDSLRDEEGSGAAAAPAKKPEGRGGNAEDVGVSQDGKPQGAALPPLRTAAHGPVQSVIPSARRGRGCELAGGTQVAAALSRLQDDMRRVLERLDTLEARVRSKVPLRREALTGERPRVCLWPASRMSVALLLVWPFAAHFLVQLYLQKRRKTKL